MANSAIWNVHYLTQEWYDKLLAELEDLKNNQLPATLERLKEAIAQWDISENAEYDTSMSEKDLIGWRISEIELMLENVEIIEHDKSSSEVTYGSIVTFIDDKDREYTMTIVWTGEVNVLESTISLESPLGIAMRWKSEGDKVMIKAPSRRYQVEILKIA